MAITDICREWRAKPEYADMPTAKLARLIYNKNPDAYASLQTVRSALSYIEGKAGPASRRYNAGSSFKKIGERPRNPYKLPESDESQYENYVIEGFKKIGVLSDIHLPYHSIEALTAAIRRLKREKIDALLLNGDVLDFYALSRFDKDPRHRKFNDELSAFADLIKTFQSELNCPIFYKLGNHEERYDHYLFMKAGELVGVNEFNLDTLIANRAPGVTVIRDKRIIKLNTLHIIHGHEFAQGIFNPVNVARGLFLRGKVTAMQGHSHATSEHTENDMSGKIVTTWSTGCLCELHPQYLPLNKWNHGFAIVSLDADGVGFQVKNYRIDKGTIY